MAQTHSKRPNRAQKRSATAPAKTARRGSQAASKGKAGTRRGAAASSKRGAQTARRGARAVAKSAGGKPAANGLSGLARKAALKALKMAGRKAAAAGAERLRSAAERGVTAAGRTTALGREAIESGIRRPLPIQVSIDVAVPLQIAWAEWMTFEFFTEGVHRHLEVERDGELLVGRTKEGTDGEWSAEVVDERDQEAFAWRSLTGSDCAGLVTFHRLSDRLTRVEMDLDLVPTRPAEALSLGLHLARRHAEAELRRFKAHVEFINPDTYDADLNGSGRDTESDK